MQPSIQVADLRQIGISVNLGGTRPAVTFYQKISILTLRVEFIREYEGMMECTRHSFLYEADQKTRLVQHNVALAGLEHLVFDKYKRNVKKAILIDNVRDEVMWHYYGKEDKFPYNIQWTHDAVGNTIISHYNYYQWVRDSKDPKMGRFENRSVNLIEDHKDALAEKIDLNCAWHRRQWEEKVKKQITRETTGYKNKQATVEKYNANRNELFDNLSKTFSAR